MIGFRTSGSVVTTDFGGVFTAGAYPLIKSKISMIIVLFLVFFLFRDGLLNRFYLVQQDVLEFQQFDGVLIRCALLIPDITCQQTQTAEKTLIRRLPVLQIVIILLEIQPDQTAEQILESGQRLVLRLFRSFPEFRANQIPEFVAIQFPGFRMHGEERLQTTGAEHVVFGFCELRQDQKTVPVEPRQLPEQYRLGFQREQHPSDRETMVNVVVRQTGCLQRPLHPFGSAVCEMSEPCGGKQHPGHRH